MPAGKTGADGALRRRFYDQVALEPGQGGVGLRLDGRPVHTPQKAELTLPTLALAEAIAEEWRAQGAWIEPETMPLTRHANSAIDGVRRRREFVIDTIMGYAASDLICYRAEGPDALIMKQMAQWDPVLDWLRRSLGAKFEIGEGVKHVMQPEASLARIKTILAAYDDFALAALHDMTALTGSALLALAHAAGLFDLQATWAAAHVDEDWQISQWGEDAEAATRRARRWRDMQAASRLLGLAAAVEA